MGHNQKNKTEGGAQCAPLPGAFPWRTMCAATGGASGGAQCAPLQGSAQKLSIVLDEGSVRPERANPTDAGLDLFAPTNLGQASLWPGGRLIVETGVHVAIPEGHVGLITSKSGLMAEHGILTTGTIDSGYTGEIRVVLFNFGHNTYYVQPGQKVAQLVIFPIETPEVRVVEKLPETARGNGGFGSTGLFAKEG